EGLLELDIDKRSRTYVVTGFGGELNGLPAAPSESAAPRKKSGSRRRRSSKSRRNPADTKAPATASKAPDSASPSQPTDSPHESHEPDKAPRRSQPKAEAASARPEEETRFGKGLEEEIPY